MYNFSILRDLKYCCNKRGNRAISQNWRYFRSRIVFFYTLLNQYNTTDKHNHTHKIKRYLAVISHSTRFKEFNRKKTATKTSNKFKIVSRHEMLVLALQNFARVVSLSSLNKLHFRYFHSSS
jgi:hypothetical protein